MTQLYFVMYMNRVESKNILVLVLNWAMVSPERARGLNIRYIGQVSHCCFKLKHVFHVACWFTLAMGWGPKWPHNIPCLGPKSSNDIK